MAQVTSTDIVNRGLQRVGAKRIAAGALFTENSKNAQEAAALYDTLRRSELNRNIWRFSVRRMALRAVDQLAPEWDSTLTYAAGVPVTYDEIVYTSLQAGNINQEPDISPSYWGLNGAANTTMAVTFAAYDGGTTYGAGQIVQAADPSGHSATWLSLQNANTGNAPGADGNGGWWTLYFGPATAVPFYSTDAASNFYANELVYDETGTVWASSGNNNTTLNDGNFIGIDGAAIAPLVVPWAANTGPAIQAGTKNVFVLPPGFLRVAPQAPTMGNQSFMGFPANLPVNDWEFEGPYLISTWGGPIVLRFAADVQDTTQFDPMFVEGLGARVAYELCETLTQSATKLQALGGEYRYFMAEARIVNAIEEGLVEPPLEDFIATRW